MLLRRRHHPTRITADNCEHSASGGWRPHREPAGERIAPRADPAIASTATRRKGHDMMNLTPTEMERLTIFSAAELARKRRAKGLRLSYVEAIAYITDEVLEGAREGRSVAELVEWGATL